MISPRVLGTTALLLLAACGSQPPANVVYKGAEYYGRNRSGGVQWGSSSDLPRQIDDGTPPVTAEAAPTAGISSSDLSAPNAAPTAPSVSSGSTYDTATRPVPPEVGGVAPPVPPPPAYDAATRPLPPEAPGLRAQPAPAPQIAPLPQGVQPLGTTLPGGETAPVTTAGAETSALPARIPSAAGKPAFVWPVEGPILSMFGKKQGGLVNDGVNIAATEGEAVQAAAPGTVIYSGNELAGYGNLVMIKHDGGYVTSYAHLSRILVDKDQQVTQGQIVGNVGKTGNVKGPQLHFGVRENGTKAVDPLGLLPSS